MNELPDPSLDRSYKRSDVKPRGNPNVLDAEQQPDEDLDRQRHHNNEERLHHHVLQDAHARVNLTVERGSGDELGNEKAGGNKAEGVYDPTENNLAYA